MSVGEMRKVNKPAVAGAQDHHHGTSTDILKQVPSAIADPIMIFESDTVPGAFVIMTELTENVKGKDVTVVVPFLLQKSPDKKNWIASVYGQKNSRNLKPHGAWFLKQFNDGKVKYIDTEKSLRWFAGHGTMSSPDNKPVAQPLSKDIRDLAKNIPNQNDLHKSRMDHEGYYRSPEEADGMKRKAADRIQEDQPRVQKELHVTPCKESIRPQLYTETIAAEYIGVSKSFLRSGRSLSHDTARHKKAPHAGGRTERKENSEYILD